MKDLINILNERVGDNAYGSATLTTQGIGGSRFTKTNRPPGIWEAEDLPIVAKRLKDVFDQVGNSEFWKNHFKSKYGIPFPTNLKDINKEQALAMNKFGTHMNKGMNEVGIAFELEPSTGGDKELKIFKNKAEADKFVQQATNIKKATQMEEENVELNGLMEDYIKSRKGVNLMEQMDKHRKRPKLMEGAMRRFFKAFDGGSTDEELVHEYAKEGLTVPEAFVSKARKQWESLKKAKLELELSEKEAKGFRQVQTTDPTDVMGMEPQSEEKHLASGLFK